MNALNFRSLWAVTVVAEEGSISRAAQHLPLSQPAVSRIVQVLEKRLGVPLFDRERSGVTLTAFGDIFVRRARRAMHYLEAAEKSLARSRDSRLGSGTPIPFHRMVASRHLEALIEIGECQSVTFAAHKMGVSQPAVQRSLRELEQLVDERLFERRSRRMTPTAAGDILIRYAKLAFAELRSAQAELSLHLGTLSGRVMIGTLPLPRTMLIPRAIAHLSRAHPDLRFSIVDGPYTTLLSALRCGDLDLMVGALRDPPPVDDVVEEVLFQDPLSIVARAGHPFMHRSEITIADLAKADWAIPCQGTPTRSQFEALFHEAGFAEPNNLVESSSLIAVRALLIESDRLTLISRSQIYYEEKLGVLSVLPIELTRTERPIGITTRVGTHASPGVQALIAELHEISRHGGYPAMAETRRGKLMA